MADPDDAAADERSDEPPERRAASRRPVRLRRAGMFDSLPRMLWHVLPGTDHFRHEASPACPCHPEVECSAQSVGGVAVFRHHLIQPEPVEDVFPRGWTASGD
jgi:hypothetical protein